MKQHNPAEKITSAEEAIQLLKEGNQRFLSGSLMNKDSHAKDREVLSEGQKPFAIVLCCADSRVAPEIYFDQKLGDIFVIRNAGNVVDPIVLGSIEYGAEHLGSPLIVVVGHSCCGAVTAACGGDELPENIQCIADVIKPSIKEGDTIDTVVRSHAVEMANQVKNDSIIQHIGTKVVPAYYDIKSGEVIWL